MQEFWLLGHEGSCAYSIVSHVESLFSAKMSLGFFFFGLKSLGFKLQFFLFIYAFLLTDAYKVIGPLLPGH